MEPKSRADGGQNVGRPPANTANTSVVHHGSKLLALNEGGRPFQVDPSTLATLGEYNYAGELNPMSFFSAHPKIHPQTGAMFNFGMSFSFNRRRPEAALDLYRVDSDGHLSQRGKLHLGRQMPFCHDFAITQNHAVFLINSTVFRDVWRALAGKTTMADCLGYDPTQPMQAIVVDLDTLGEIRRFTLPAGTAMHFGNAFEVGDDDDTDGQPQDDADATESIPTADVPEERIRVDATFLTHPEMLDDLNNIFNARQLVGGELRRWTLNLTTGEASHEALSNYPLEFPMYDLAMTGRRTRYTYGASNVATGVLNADGFFNAIVKVDTEGEDAVSVLEPGCYASEPMFARSDGSQTTPQETDDGYLLLVEYNAESHTSALAIHRADDPGERVALARIGHHLPHQFHGFWRSADL